MHVCRETHTHAHTNSRTSKYVCVCTRYTNVFVLGTSRCAWNIRTLVIAATTSHLLIGRLCASAATSAPPLPACSLTATLLVCSLLDALINFFHLLTTSHLIGGDKWSNLYVGSTHRRQSPSPSSSTSAKGEERRESTVVFDCACSDFTSCVWSWRLAFNWTCICVHTCIDMCVAQYYYCSTHDIHMYIHVKLCILMVYYIHVYLQINVSLA